MSNSDRKLSKKVKCEFCDKEVFERGLVSHIRLKHKLKLTQKRVKVTVVEKETYQPIVLEKGKKIIEVSEPIERELWLILNHRDTHTRYYSAKIQMFADVNTYKEEIFEGKRKSYIRVWCSEDNELSMEEKKKWFDKNRICPDCKVLLRDNKCPLCGKHLDELKKGLLDIYGSFNKVE